MSTRIKAVRWVGAALVTVAIVPWLGTSAATAAAPPSGDTRAVSHEGNAVTCADAGLAGSDITNKVTSSDDGTYIDITAVDAGYTVTGVVVKAGDGYNVYLPGALGALPWLDLHGPLVGQNENVPQISHWYVCGTTDTTTPSGEGSSGEESTGEESTGEESTGEESTPGSSVLPTKIGSSGETSVLGTKTGVLAATGVDLPLGAALGLSFALLFAGGALLALPSRMAVEGKRRH